MKTTIGELIKHYREGVDISQRQLAKDVGISNSMISRYEANDIDPSFTTMIRIARRLDLSLDAIAGSIQSKAWPKK